MRAVLGVLLLMGGAFMAVQSETMRRKREEWNVQPADVAAVDILARTIWGEARGEGAEGMAAVAAVIVNRARRGGWWGNSIRAVCLKPWQFSCWNPTDPNRVKLLTVGTEDAAFRVALEIARQAVAGTLPDPTGGATHYHNATVSPTWAKGAQVSAQIGGHVFYRGVA